MKIQDALDYEIANSPIAGYVSIEWMQEILSKYYGWKVNRKYRRYQRFLKIKQIFKHLHNEN